MKRLFGALLALALLCALTGTAYGQQITMDYTAIVRSTYWDGTYTGTCFGGVPDGSGVFEYENIGRSGDTYSGSYVGEWSSGRLNGQGTLTEYKNGELVWIFEGGWKDGMFYGEGRILGDDGEVLYEGFFVDPYIVDASLSDAVNEYFSDYGMAPVNEQTRDYIEDEVFLYFSDYGSPPFAEDPMSLYFDVEQYLEDPSSAEPWLVRIPLGRIRDTRREETTGFYMLEAFFTDTDGQAYCGLMRGDDSYLSYADSLYALPLGTAVINGRTHIMCLLLNDYYDLESKAKNAPVSEQAVVEGTIDITPTIYLDAWTGTYTGELIDGQPDGDGVFEGVKQTDGRLGIVYEGEWRGGLPEGYGEISYRLDGEIVEMYEGNWLEGNPDGQGMSTSLTNGVADSGYKGGWKKGYRYGQGTFYKENNEVLMEGLTDNNYIVEALWPDVVIEYCGLCNVKFDDHTMRDFIEEHTFDVFFEKYSEPIPEDLLIPDFNADLYLSDQQAYEPGLVRLDIEVQYTEPSVFKGYRTLQIVMNDSARKYMCLMRGTGAGIKDAKSLYILPLGVRELDGEKYIIGLCVNDLDEPQNSLKQGDTGELVLKMKQRMQKLGYFSAGAQLSDQYNATCTERVKQFQQVNGLKQTGVADGETLQLLYSEDAKPKP